MEWKEHVRWFAPVLATVVAFIVTYYGPRLAEKDRLRKAALVLFTIAFLASAVAGLFGAFLNKVAPIR
jgi:glucan phosphoethanolaminetransferase (alkaline phosphatase superfamily)